MRSWLHKYRKRMLVAVLAIFLPPIFVVLLLWWDAQPKKPPQVTVSYVKNFSERQSNTVVFALTNESSYRIGFVVYPETNDAVHS